MTFRPGINLVRGLAALAVVAAAGLALPALGWLFAAGFAVCATLAIRDAVVLRRRMQAGRLNVTRTLPALVGRNLPFPLEWTVSLSADPGQGPSTGSTASGRTDSPSMTGALRDEIPVACLPRFAPQRLSLAVGGRQTIAQEFRIPVRGTHRFGPIWVRLAGPARFLEAQTAVECPGAVRILPETYASRDELVKDIGATMLLIDKITRSRQHGVGTEFESLAEFRDGDDPRRIDWRTSAKHRRPIVRRFQIERHRDVVILIDCGRMMGTDAGRGTKLDRAVDSALILGRVALQSGDRCGMGLFDSDVRGYLPPVSGPASIGILAEAVHDAQVRWQESDFTRMYALLQSRQAKRSLVVILSDVSDAETSEQFRASLLGLGRRHVVLFAALRTPHLARILHEPVETMLDGARKAVTLRLLRERDESLHALRRGGIHVVDVEPQELTLPLINQFIELRQRNLL